MRFLKSLAAVLAASCSLVANGAGTWQTTLKGINLDGDPATYEAYYDQTLDITWLAAWNLAPNMTWPEASAWASNLSLGGATDWRLPHAQTDGCVWSCVDSELGSLWYETLGNPASNAAVFDPGPFTGIARANYWTGDTRTGGIATTAYVFSMFNGMQASNAHLGSAYAAIAVHDGEVGAVPEPATWGLLLVGLAALGVAQRRR